MRQDALGGVLSKVDRVPRSGQHPTLVVVAPQSPSLPFRPLAHLHLTSGERNQFIDLNLDPALVSRDMHLLDFEIAKHDQRLSRLKDVPPKEHLLRIIACLQEGYGHLIRFVPNEIQDHNARCFRVHELIFPKLCGGFGLSRGFFRYISRWVFSSHFVRSRFAQDRGFPARSPNRGGAGAPRSRLDITKEAGLPPLFPIRRIIRGDTGARTQLAEERMMNRIDYNPGMSAPDGQVARLRTCDSSKFVDPRIKVRRARVFIRQTGALIDSVDKVGAVESKLRVIARIQRNVQNRQPLAASHRPGPDRLLLQVRSLTSDSVSPVGTCLLFLR